MILAREWASKGRGGGVVLCRDGRGAVTFARAICFINGKK